MFIYVLSPPQSFPHGIPMKNSNDWKIASALGTIGRGKRQDPLFPFPSSPARFSFPSPQPRFEFYVLRSVHTRRQVAATRRGDRSLHVYRSHKFCLIWFFATCCCDKILLQRQRFSQKFSSTHEAICTGLHFLLSYRGAQDGIVVVYRARG